MAKQKLFTKSIDDMLFAQYKFGSDFDKQKVVCKIFNPYGDGTWYIMNSDPNDPDYLWAIVKMFGNVEVGSVLRSELESISFFGMNLGLERDISFEPTNAKQVYEGLLKGEHFANGGKLSKDHQSHIEDVIMDKYDAVLDELGIEYSNEIMASDELQKKLNEALQKAGIDKMYSDCSVKERKKISVACTNLNYHTLNNYLSLKGYNGDAKQQQYIDNYEKYKNYQIYLNPNNFISGKFANGGKFVNNVEKLKNTIRNKSKKIYDESGNVVYLGGEEKSGISNYTDLKPYSSQASDGSVSVSFSAPNRTMVIFQSQITEPFEDTKSYEKYGGLKYKYEPLTEKISTEILEKVKFAKGGKIGFKGLSEKVAARYKGKSVPAKYQSEYGKTYDAAEAKEVGNKVAAKVYRQQLAKKKFALGGNTSDQPKIYVEELIAHKEGLDDGEWIILTDYNDGDEIMDYINDLLEQWSEKYGEERDEYIVSAYENFDEEYYDKFMDEIQFDEILEAHNKGGNLQEISDDKDIPVDVLEQIVSDFDPDDLAEWIDENYFGHFNSERELAEEYVQSIGGLSELSTNQLEYHFDYHGFGSDLASDYSEYDGYYFRNYKRGGVMPKHDLSKYVKKKGKFAVGGQTEFIDLFEDYEKQPPQLRRIIEKYEKKFMDGDMDYSDTAKMQAEVVKIGYVFDSGLDNEPYGLRPVGVKLGQLRGYEGEKSDNDVLTVFDKFAKGGLTNIKGQNTPKEYPVLQGDVDIVK